MRATSSSPGPSLESRVGQLLVVGFEGTRPEDVGVCRLRALAEAGDVGGAIFFSHNIDTPDQVRVLTAHMRTWQCPRPLWLVVDQEGGRVQRLRPERGFAGWASAHEMGAASATEAWATFAGLAQQVAHFGFDLNLAPVVDLHVAGSPAIGGLGRSFGADPAHVVARAQQVVEAHRARRVATALKHFPGHGSARGDTHRGFTDVTSLHAERELLPFARLIASGHADMVMTSHLVHAGMTGDDQPLTLSRRAVYDGLRIRMDFDGVIISDDLFMGALTDVAGGMPKVVAGALASGHDMLIISGNRAARGGGSSAFAPEAAQIVMDLRRHIVEGLRAGHLDADDVAQSCERVDRLRRSLPA